MSYIDKKISDAEIELGRLIKIREAINRREFPITIKIFAYASNEYLYKIGNELGLTGEALDYFSHADEYEITILVGADGSVNPVGVK